MAVIIDEFEAIAESAQTSALRPTQAAARTPVRDYKLRQKQRIVQARAQRLWAH